MIWQPLRWRYWVDLFRRRKLTQDLDEEIGAHINIEIQRRVEQGESPAEARTAALREVRSVTFVKEATRDAWAWTSFERLAQDLRYAVRMLRRSPGFSAVAILSLALGIGANTAVFTLINAILLQALPVVNPHELVQLQAFISFPMYRDLLERQQVFTDIFASAGEGPFRITVLSANGQSAELDNMPVGRVSGNYFPLLGVQPAIGRFLNGTDDQNPNSSESTGSVVVLSDAFWERQFGRNPQVLNRTILIGRSPCTVIGVAPRGFFGDVVGNAPVAWVPLIPFSPANSLTNRRGQFTDYIARLKPGVNREQAQAAMTVLFRQLLRVEGLQKGINETNVVLTAADSGGDSFLRRTFAKPLWIIMAIVGLVLLITCANVGNLLLARSAFRRGEVAIRLAIGCSRQRLFRQLLTESVLLSFLGGIAGIGVAYWGSQQLLRMIAFFPLPIHIDLRPDPRVLGFLIAVSVFTGIGFGLLPALRSLRLNLAPALKSGHRGSVGTQRRQRLNRVLVTCQMALSLLLVIGAGLLIRSLYNLRSLDWGFRPENVVIFDLAHSPQHTEPEALSEVARQVYQTVGQLPGVQSASVSWLTIFGGSDLSFPIKIRDYTPTEKESARWAFIGQGLVMVRNDAVSPRYFETIGMRLLEGRSIRDEDGPDSPLVAVINEAMARRYFGTDRAVGHFMTAAVGPAKDKPIEIVGIVHDSKYNDLRQDTKPLFYLPIRQMPRPLSSIEVRTSEPLSVIAGQVHQAVAEVTKDIMIRRVVSLSDQVDQSLAADRLVMRLCSFFGILALLLACVGLYGVMSYTMAQRTGEVGIRMALGANKRAVISMVLGDTLWMVLAGVVVGSLLAFGATRFLSSFIFGLTTTDPETIVLAVLLLLAAATLAAYVPARRAARVDPTVALRHE